MHRLCEYYMKILLYRLHLCSAAFKEHALILYDKAWYDSKSVVWKGPPYLTLMPAIEEKYRHLRVLFQERLRIEDAPADIIAKELRHFSSTVKEVVPGSRDFYRLLSLLRHASESVTSITKKELADWTPTIRNCAILPVRSPSENPTAALKLVSANSKEFFVRDIGKQMYHLFRDVVPFLALSSLQLYEASGFLEHLGILPGRRINSFVSRSVDIDGKPITATSSWDDRFNEDDSEYFKSRLPYLQRYVVAVASQVYLLMAWQVSLLPARDETLEVHRASRVPCRTHHCNVHSRGTKAYQDNGARNVGRSSRKRSTCFPCQQLCSESRGQVARCEESRGCYEHRQPVHDECGNHRRSSSLGCDDEARGDWNAQTRC